MALYEILFTVFFTVNVTYFQSDIMDPRTKAKTMTSMDSKDTKDPNVGMTLIDIDYRNGDP